MKPKRTEWTDAAGWTRFEVRDDAGRLIESGIRSPSGHYDDARLHIPIAVDDLHRMLDGLKKT